MSHLLFAGSVSSGITGLLQKKNGNFSLSPLSDWSLLYPLPPHRKLISISPISVQVGIPQNSPLHQQAASLISSISRCFSIQKYFIAVGFLRQGVLILQVRGLSVVFRCDRVQSTCTPLRHHGYNFQYSSTLVDCWGRNVAQVWSFLYLISYSPEFCSLILSLPKPTVSQQQFIFLKGNALTYPLYITPF